MSNAENNVHAQIEEICARTIANPGLRMVELAKLRKKVEADYLAASRAASYNCRVQEAALAHLLVKIEEAEMEIVTNQPPPNHTGVYKMLTRESSQFHDSIPIIVTDTDDDDGETVSPDSPHSPEPRKPPSEEPRLERQHARIWSSPDMTQREPSILTGDDDVSRVLDFNEAYPIDFTQQSN